MNEKSTNGFYLFEEKKYKIDSTLLWFLKCQTWKCLFGKKLIKVNGAPNINDNGGRPALCFEARKKGERTRRRNTSMIDRRVKQNGGKLFRARELRGEAKEKTVRVVVVSSKNGGSNNGQNNETKKEEWGPRKVGDHRLRARTQILFVATVRIKFDKWAKQKMRLA